MPDQTPAEQAADSMMAALGYTRADQKPAPDLYEVVWFAAFGHLEQIQTGVRASDLRATVLGIIKAIAASGLVVVSAADLKHAANRLEAADADAAGYVPLETELIARLRAALPAEADHG